MLIKTDGFSDDEIKLFEMADRGDRLFDQTHFNVINKTLIVFEGKNKCVFKVFTYKNSLRFTVLSVNLPSREMIDWVYGEICRYVTEYKKASNNLLYSQINGFSDELIKRFKNQDNLNHFYNMRIEKDNIDLVVDLKGLIKRKCAADMIDACIDVMEDLFTPFPDTPGSFRNDKARVSSDFLNECGGAELFFKDDGMVGFCGHKEGHFTEVCVRKEYQGKGYGETIVRSVLKSVYEQGYDAELTTGVYNTRAISLYKKVGFNKECESIRINFSINE